MNDGRQSRPPVSVPPRAGSGLLSEPRATAVTSSDRDGPVTPEPSLTTATPATETGDTAPRAAPPAGRIGSMIARYTVLGELGSGGMGVVYKAWDPALDRAVALKVLIGGRFAPRRHTQRFLDEARAIARLDHPALVEVYDIGVVDGCPYFTMACVDGSDLRRLVADGPIDPLRASRLIAAVARGLGQAHALGIVHRDVKPANILVDLDDTPRLIDFGIARFLESTDDRTRTGQVVGTPAYMAPEQAAGDLAAIGPATDVFGLGASLYQAVTGALPRRVPDGERSALDSADRAGLSRDLLAICHKALAGDPRRRYPSAAALADDLDRFARGEPVHAALPGPWRRLRWRIRRGRGALIGAAVATAVALSVWLAVDAWQTARAERRQQDREVAAEARLDETLADARRLRAADDAVGAAAIEREVTLRRDVQETRALARFHLGRASDAIARQAAPEAIAAASSAYAAAVHPAESFEALDRLGRLFAETHRAGALRALLTALEERFPERRTALAPLELEAAILERRLSDAAGLARAQGSPRAPLLDALSHARATAWDDASLGAPPDDISTRGDVDGDGQPEVIIGTRLLQTHDPRLPELPLPPLPDGQVPHPLGPGLVVGSGGDRPARLLTLEDAGSAAPRWQARGPVEGSRHFAYHALAGRPIVYGAAGWHLHAFSPMPWDDTDTIDGMSGTRDGIDDGIWHRMTPHPPSEAIRAEPRGMTIADFGAAGPAVVLGSGGWQSYDLRVYTPAPDGRLILAARRKLGEIGAVATVPRAHAAPLIAVALRAFPGDPRLFPAESPAGAPPGLHLIEWTAAGLELRAHLPLVSEDFGQTRLAAGDVDGDGRADLIVSMRPATGAVTRIYRALVDGGWSAPVSLPGFRFAALAQVDADPADEIVVRADDGGRLWILGAGDAALPPLAPGGERLPAPDRRALDDRTAALLDLEQLGLIDEAIDGWRTRMRLGLDPAEAAWQAARLTERQRPAAAAELYLRAAESPAYTAEALTAAARNWRAARTWTAEHAALGRLLALDVPDAVAGPARARHQALAERLNQRWTVDLDGPLAPQWQIVVPDRLQRGRARGGLLIRADLVGLIARLPLAPTGGPIALEVELETLRVEYGGSVILQLVAVDAEDRRRPLATVLDVGWGGGSIVYQRAYALRPGGAHAVFFNRPLSHPVGDPLHARIELDDGRMTIVEYTTGLREQHPAEGPRPGERLAFEITSGPGDRRMGQQLRARLRRLVFDGLRPLPEAADDPLDVAGRALADGEPTAALAALADRDERAADAIRAAALYDLGRWDEADGITLAGLPRAAAGSPFERFVRGRILRDPIHFAPLTRRALGAGADALLWRVHVAALDKHSGDPEVAVAARAALLGTGGEPPERLAASPSAEQRLDLLQARAAMHRAGGRLGAARADLERWAALLSHLPPPEGRPAEQARAARWADLARLRAEVLADAGHPTEAAEAVRTALAVAPAPELTADALLASPSLRTLRSHPVWAEVERAAAWSDISP